MTDDEREAPARRGRKFDLVVTSATDVFLRQGYAATRMDDIAERAGVSKATLYNYFPDKAALFREVIGLHAVSLTDRLLDHVDPDWGPARALRASGHQLLRYLLSDRRITLLRLCIAESGRMPGLGERYHTTSTLSVRRQVARLLAALVARGDLILTDPDLAAAQFVMLCHTDLTWRRIFGVAADLGEAERERIVGAAVGVFLARYGAEGPAARPLNPPGGYEADCPPDGSRTA